MIRDIKIGDIKEINNIYNYYIKNTVITFEEKELKEEDMQTKVEKIFSKFPYIVYEENNKIIGYAYADTWRDRTAFRNTVEITVYLKNGKESKGIGTDLYKELIRKLKEKKVHSIIAVITLPNEKSVKLHEKFNFKKVAHFDEVGYKFDEWLDVGCWELLI